MEGITLAGNSDMIQACMDYFQFFSCKIPTSTIEANINASWTPEDFFINMCLRPKSDSFRKKLVTMILLLLHRISQITFYSDKLKFILIFQKCFLYEIIINSRDV